MMSNSGSPEESDGGQADHLHEVEDGAGCTEIWAHLSRRREEND
jgi:hypothetical protein